MTKQSKSPDPANLGELEMSLLNEIWRRDWCSVSDLHEILQGKREIAYTTVMTVLGRLYDQGYLKRRKRGRAYLYQAKVKRDAVAMPLFKRVVDRLLGGDMSPVVGFLSGSQLSASEIKAMEEMLAAQKEGLQSGDGEVSP